MKNSLSNLGRLRRRRQKPTCFFARFSVFLAVLLSGSPAPCSSFVLSCTKQAKYNRGYRQNVLHASSPTSKYKESSPVTQPKPLFMDIFERSAGRPMSQIEMIATSLLGVVLTFTVLYVLGLSNKDSSDLQSVSYNIIEKAVPQKLSDIVSVSIGEAIAGIIGAGVSIGISKLNSAKSIKVSQSVADADFLLSRAASYPLLESVGLSPVLASTASTVVAIVPYVLVKFGAERRKQLIEEGRQLDEMLLQQNQNMRNNRGRGWFLKKAAPETFVDPTTLLPVRNETAEFDAVELFSDVVKWLQYNVLLSDYSGSLTFNDLLLEPGVEAAIFGSIAAMSSQVYSDVLYAYFGFGGEQKRVSVRSRSLENWLSLYGSRFLYYAVLFGTYEAVQIPAKESVSALLSGGIDACFGSSDFDACVDTYVLLNPPAASPEAQFRALVTAFVSFWNNLWSTSEI